MAELLATQMIGPVLHLIMRDTATRNSLSEEMMRAFADALAKVESDSKISVVIVRAEGPVFSSGHNLKQLSSARQSPDGGMSYFSQVFDSCSALMMQIARSRCAVIAEVQGLASAAGCQLAATCDLVYASDAAGFCTPGVNIGLFCSTPMVALSRAVPHKHAMEMLLTGDVVDAQAAYRMGLVNRVVDKSALRGTVDAAASKIATKSQAAIRFGKRAYRDQLELPLDTAYHKMQQIMVQNMMDGAACEGIDAFLNKREARWP
jgi:enoyl-CoA hydratase/carnithine racemase